MSQFSFTPESLLRGMTLVERVCRTRAKSSCEVAHDPDLARREYDAWRQLEPFRSSTAFEARLASDGIASAEIERVMGEVVESAQTAPAERPSWASAIEAAFASERHGNAWSIRLANGERDTSTLRFLDAIEPLIRSGRDALFRLALDIAREHPDAPFDAESAVQIMLAPLPWSLNSMLMRAMVLEVNVARISGELTGATPAERFDQFAERLRDPKRAFAFLVDYPVLARLVHETIDSWVRFAGEFLLHLAVDAEPLRKTFATSASCALNRLERIDGGVGDTHRGGRTVIVAHFEGGARVVYKPRSLAVDVHFQELLTWLNARSTAPALRTLRVLDRSDHGWVEFVHAAPCESKAALQRFYRRQGALIAVLYVLEAVDFHFENLIASGEDPVLVDLETLFHARFESEEPEEASLRLVAGATAASVQRIGILPQRVHATDEFAGVDLSGLSAEAGQLTPQKVLQWSDMATDEMRARRERVAMPGANNLPTIAADSAEAPSVIRFRNEIAEGFADAYRLFVEHRADLLSATGPIARFGDDSVRCVLRPTSVYGALLSESFHPDYLRDGLERDRFLDRIHLGMRAAPHLARVVAHERADLAAGDVPFFTTSPRSRDLRSARGDVVTQYLPASGLDLVFERIRALCPQDLERQLWYVQASLATLEISRASLEWATYPTVVVDEILPPEETRRALMRQATRVGDRLIELSLRDGRDVAWMGLQYDERTWSIVPLLEDLYSGVAGVILFLAQLGVATGEPRFEEIARAAFGTYRRRMELAARNVRVIGPFNGLSGSIFVQAHLSRVWNEPEAATAAHELVPRIAEHLDHDQHLDVIGGSAGLIAALESLQHVAPAPSLDELARRAADRIVAAARPMKSGVGWFTLIETEAPITGFSHGAAGFAWALAKMFARTGDERYRRTAVDAVLYERSRLVVKEGNWLETSREKLAQPPEKRGDGALSVAWCYGAPGIGLSRLECLGILDHPFVREDIDIAVRTTLARGFGRNHSICHGDLGNLELIMRAAERFDDDVLRETSRRIRQTISASIDASGFLCGVPLGVESPSLMNGLAGIGYGLLRAAHPERIPSILTLEAPSI